MKTFWGVQASLSTLAAAFVALALLTTPAGAATPGPALAGVGARASSLTVGPEGKVWFGGATIWPSGQELPGLWGFLGSPTTLTQFGFGTPQNNRVGAVKSVAVGPDGDLWATAGGEIARLGADGSATEFPLVHSGDPIVDAFTQNPSGTAIASGSDGALWFTAPEAIGRITTAGAVSHFDLAAGAGPHGIVAGPDGALWFTEEGAGAIGRITTAGAVSTYSLPNPAAKPHEITVGPDGNLWFTEAAGTQIGRITPSGEITEFAAETAGPIVSGPDGDLWFASHGGIGSISTAGTFKAASCAPGGCAQRIEALAYRHEGNLWFAGEPVIEGEAGGGTLQLVSQEPGFLATFPVAAPAVAFKRGTAAFGARWARLRASCTVAAAGQTCEGTLRLKAGGRQVASRRIRLLGGESRAIAVKLNGNALQALRRKKTLTGTATMTISGVAGAGSPVVLRRPPHLHNDN
jgi:streptogramin lyase